MRRVVRFIKKLRKYQTPQGFQNLKIIIGDKTISVTSLTSIDKIEPRNNIIMIHEVETFGGKVLSSNVMNIKELKQYLRSLVRKSKT